MTICFFFIFQECLFCNWFNTENTILKVFYYCFFPAAFNLGWASVQVAHMSLVPSLTLSRKRRDLLNNLRNTFTYIANLFVLVFAFLVFLLLKYNLSISHLSTFSSGFLQFQVLALGSLGLGCLTSFFFLLTVSERKLISGKVYQKIF